MTRDYFIQHGIFSPDENAAIFDKWFTGSPSHFLAYAVRRYGLASKIVTDVGAAYGHAIRLFGPGSYGLELNAHCVAFANAVGLRTYQRDAENDDLSDLPRVDAVWCRDVLEHVDSPHVLLRKLWYLLKDDGLAFVVVPMVSSLRPLRHFKPLRRRTAGYLAEDHRNFFSTATLRLTSERAGYEVHELTAAFPLMGWLVDRMLLAAVPSVLAVLRKVPDWEYDRKSTRRAANNGVGYEYKNPILT